MSDKRKYADRAEYLKKAVSLRRKKLREKAVILLGKRCSICKYSRCPQALEFHHIDGLTKEFGISESGITRSWARIQKELIKCILLCANCHREVHVGITQLPVVRRVEK
jgi:hypothetical protein